MSDLHDGRPQVLLFSHDHGLLSTRRFLLEHAGYSVAGVTSIPEFRACVLSRSFQLVLLCQSASAEECGAAAQFAHEHLPAARLIVMFTRAGKRIAEHVDVLLDALAGPKAFLETAERMLAMPTRDAHQPGSPSL